MARDLALYRHVASAGVSVRQVGCAYGQREWKAQPLGMSSPCGTSPTMGRVQGGVRPGGVAAATRVAVYGCLGWLQMVLAWPISTSLPRYITPIQSLICSTVARSWLISK